MFANVIGYGKCLNLTQKLINKTKIMDRQKLIHQLFIDKVADVLGVEKTTELLKEAKKAFAIPDVSNCEHDFVRTGDSFDLTVYCSKCDKKG